MSPRYSPEVFNAVKTATKLMVSALGGLDAAASCCQVGRSQLSDYCNINSEKFIPAHVTLEMERFAGMPFVTQALAQAAGYTLLPIEPLRERSALAVLLARLGQDTGEIFATAATALGHGTPTETERARLLQELGDLHRVAGETIRFLQQDARA